LLCISADYKATDPYLEAYLTSVGRRKFLEPIYERLVTTEAGKEKALRIFRKASAGYHSVSRNTIKDILAKNSVK
jgi:hypothetical protein